VRTRVQIEIGAAVAMAAPRAMGPAIDVPTLVGAVGIAIGRRDRTETETATTTAIEIAEAKRR
jgi:hypothetical protein